MIMKIQESIYLNFNLYKGEELLSAGKLVSNRKNEFTSFGKHNKISFPDAEDEFTYIFTGLTLSHEYDGEGLSMTLNYYDLNENDDLYLGLEQVHKFESGIRIGKLSGAEESESIMIGEEYEFVYQTKLLP